MADHWKSIANLLGAPGVDEPESETQGKEPAMDADTTSSFPPEKGAPADSGDEAATPSDESLSFREPARESRNRLESVTEQPAAQPEPPAKEEPINEMPAAEMPAPKVKRKSSWESLASMFNIKVERPKPVEEEPPAKHEPIAETSRQIREPQADDEAPRESAREDKGKSSSLSIFSAESDNPNPALEAMFGDVPRDDDWGGSRPRVIDDLGWGDDEDDEPKPARRHEPIADDSDSEDAEIHDKLDEEPVRRGRRRRRGRRGRGDASETKTEPAAEKRLGWDEDEPELAESSVDDDWNEPVSFAADDAAEELDAEDGGEVQRRSSRRRRRGRGRGRDSGAPVDSPVSRSSEEPTADVDEVDDEIHADQADADVVSRSRDSRDRDSEAGDDGERSSRGRRRRRGGRSSGAGRTSQASHEDVAPPELDLDDPDPDADGEGHARDGSKHRNIPTWADSVQSLVEANIENRRRNDNRGAPRGRPRGRR